jgi:Zn-dependent M28 family amino/carboxypeptidase
LGIRSSGSDGDSIFHGALDNASGIAGLLELARLFVAGPPPQRSILFIATTAEEKGLFGAGYYAANPLYPLELTVANLNIDMLSTKGVTRDVSSMGNGKVQLQDEIEKIARMHGRYFVADPNLEAGYFFRGDHFPFAKAGVPAITFSSGEDMVKGGVEAGKEWLADFVKNRYHQTTDRWSADWDTSGQIADLHLLFDLGRDLANSHRWPGWSQDSEFKAIRDRSKHMRTV